MVLETWNASEPQLRKKKGGTGRENKKMKILVCSFSFSFTFRMGLIVLQIACITLAVLYLGLPKGLYAVSLSPGEG